MTRPKNKKCYICGNLADSSDHIPPDGIFPDPKPKNLITVPACKECNEKTSLDDEYFRTIIAVASYESSDAQMLLDKKITRQLKKRPALQKYLVGKMKKVNLFSEGGIYIEKGYAFECDQKRVHAIVEKIVKGLYLHEKGFPLNKQCCVTDFILNPKMDEKFLKQVSLLPIKRVGDGKIFLYRYLLYSKDSNITAWFLVFFEKILIVAYTGIFDGGKPIRGTS
ncbi:MAG: hypothetical protein ACYSRZ_09010 [Planctomycetota bacterium]|jgi:hypothetical protein